LLAGGFTECVEHLLIVRLASFIGHVHAALKPCRERARIGNCVSDDGRERFAPSAPRYAVRAIRWAREWSDELRPRVVNDPL
jgi:hypothetical protein